MGNRAVIAFKSEPEVGIYLHWNGGIGSVSAFVAEARRRELRDGEYGVARLTQIIGEFLSYSAMSHKPDYILSLGVGCLKDMDCDNGDNGLYWIGEDFKIASREFVPDSSIEMTEHEANQMESITRFFLEHEKRIVK